MWQRHHRTAGPPEMSALAIPGTRPGGAPAFGPASPRATHDAILGIPFRRSLLREIRADRWLYACIGVYAIAAGLISLAIGQSRNFDPFLYLTDGIEGALLIIFPVILVRAGVAVAM